MRNPPQRNMDLLRRPSCLIDRKSSPGNDREVVVDFHDEVRCDNVIACDAGMC